MLVETPYKGEQPESKVVKLTTAPSGAATNKKGSSILFDKHLPTKINGIDVIKSTAHHESKERRLMDEGLPYKKAHPKAEKYENSFIPKNKRQSYQEKINNAIRKINDKYDPDIDPRVKNAKEN